MPELPEVESVRRVLAQHLPEERIQAVLGEPIAMRRPLDHPALRKVLVGKRLLTPRRRSKYLLFDLEGGGSVLSHLGMSGRFRIAHPSDPVEKHTHLRLALSGGEELRFIDPRRFGFFVYLAPGEEARDSSLAKLGLDPLATEFPELLPDLLRQSRAPMKTLLMDQQRVAGLGNIYVAEALWRARIRPLRQGRRVSVKRLRALAHHIQDILGEAIEGGGTTLRDHTRPDGEPGAYAIQLEVYGREGQPCVACGRPLHGEVLSGRSTVWCKHCQR